MLVLSEVTLRVLRFTTMISSLSGKLLFLGFNRSVMGAYNN